MDIFELARKSTPTSKPPFVINMGDKSVLMCRKEALVNNGLNKLETNNRGMNKYFLFNIGGFYADRLNASSIKIFLGNSIGL